MGFLKKQRKEPKPDPNVQRVLKVDQNLENGINSFILI